MMFIDNRYISRFIMIKRLLMIFGLLAGVLGVSAQGIKTKTKGWEITYKPLVAVSLKDTLIGKHPADESLESAAALQKEAKDLIVILDVTSSDIRLMTKQRDKTIYLVNKTNDSAFVQHNEHEFHYTPLRVQEDKEDNKILFTKESKNILGYRCYKAFIKTKEEQFSQINIWYTKKLPNAYWPEMAFLKGVPGCVMQIEFTNGQQSAGIIAQNIASKKWTADYFLPATNNNGITNAKKLHRIHGNCDGGSAFQFGFARITKKDTLFQKKINDKVETSSLNSAVEAPPEPGIEKIQSFYIDTMGKRAFDEIIEGAFSDRSHLDASELPAQNDTDLLPKDIVLVRKGQHYGMLTAEGDWILKPEYDSIDTRMRKYWVLKRAGKESLYSKEGLLLPFQFEKVWRMDDNFYNVLQNGRWGVYDRKRKALTVPAIYEDMDFCYGCEVGGDYCFAEKNGKWGVIDFNNKVLLPFEYDHEHWNMRSDNWVTCLYKNGQQLIINLKTGSEKVCPPERATQTDSTQLAQGFVSVRKGDKYGLLNPKGRQILPYEYDFIRYDAARPGTYYLPAPYVQINKNGKWGVADTTGKILIAPVYTSGISLELGEYFICEKKKGEGYSEVLLDKTGKRVLDSDYDKIDLSYTYNDSVPYFELSQKDLYGLYNPATKVLIEPKFSQIDGFLFNIQQRNSVKVAVNDTQGLMDIHSGKMIVPAVFNKIYAQDSMDQALFIVGKESKLGLYSAQKKQLVIPLKYSNLSFTGEDHVLEVNDDNKYGLITSGGKVLVPSRYFEIRTLQKGFYLLTQQDSAYYNTFSFYDRKNSLMRKAPDSTIAIYNDRLAIIKDNGFAKLWRPLENKVIVGDYASGGWPEQIGYFAEGLAVAYKKGRAGVIDTSGKVVIPFNYDGLTSFQNGYALILSDKVGQDNPDFDQNTRDFLNGYKHYGFIDSTGKVVVPAKYDLQWNSSLDEYFNEDYLVLFNGNQWDEAPKMGLAAKNGDIIIAPLYNKVILQQNGPDYVVEKDKKFGLLNEKGQVILPTQFDNISLQENPVYQLKYKISFPVLAEKDGVWQYYNRDGKVIADIKTEKMIPFNPGIY
ncbi:GLPGLI family protein [Arachidicoccus rhizosphaerae]|uniref:GLPGLI family protein n=2 Tax=Arachidicoccus rhizosphaerae TaxID=551991 RepID=A0A1H3ZH23_9BACT|nr:GLPGLI family protein [Arachidicoccus rhizosphaerae]